MSGWLWCSRVRRQLTKMPYMIIISLLWSSKGGRCILVGRSNDQWTFPAYTARSFCNCWIHGSTLFASFWSDQISIDGTKAGPNFWRTSLQGHCRLCCQNYEKGGTPGFLWRIHGVLWEMCPACHDYSAVDWIHHQRLQKYVFSLNVDHRSK